MTPDPRIVRDIQAFLGWKRVDPRDVEVLVVSPRPLRPRPPLNRDQRAVVLVALFVAVAAFVAACLVRL
jgi:hypothetical protein